MEHLSSVNTDNDTKCSVPDSRYCMFSLFSAFIVGNNWLIEWQSIFDESLQFCLAGFECKWSVFLWLMHWITCRYETSD